MKIIGSPVSSLSYPSLEASRCGPTAHGGAVHIDERRALAAACERLSSEGGNLQS
jgi:hypothetical protein